MPLISVILPVYNTASFIAEAIESILSQTFTDFELLIINDASTDNTLQIIEQYTDPRIKVINNPENCRVVKSLNKGIELSKGVYIARMDADDISMPTRFQKQIDFFKQHPDTDICSTWVYKFGERNFAVYPAVEHENLKASLFFHNVIIHPSVMFKKESLARHRLNYRENFVNAEDYGLWAEAIDTVKFATVPEFLLKYRIHPNNVSIQKESNWQVVKAMNYRVFKTMFSRMALSANEQEMAIHLNMGFRLTTKLSGTELNNYTFWLRKIVKANNRACYLNKKSLQSEVIKTIVFFTRNSVAGAGKYVEIAKAIVSIYNPLELMMFLPYQWQRSKLFNKRINMPVNRQFLQSVGLRAI